MQSYKSQQASALHSVRTSRAARSFVAAGANNGLPPLKLRVQSPTGADDGSIVSLKIVDRSGALVNAADFYEFMRQHFCEIYHLHRALKDHVDGYDDCEHSTDMFQDAYDALHEEGYFGPRAGDETKPWPVFNLFYGPGTWVHLYGIARRIYEAHGRADGHARKPPPRCFEALYARRIFERANSPDDTLNHTLEFVGGVFLPRNDLQAVMSDVVDSFNENYMSEWDGWSDEAWIQTYCRKDQIVTSARNVPSWMKAFWKAAVWDHVQIQAEGGAGGGGSDLLWIVYQDDGRTDPITDRTTDDPDEAVKLICEQLNALDADQRADVLARVNASFA